MPLSLATPLPINLKAVRRSMVELFEEWCAGSLMLTELSRCGLDKAKCHLSLAFNASNSQLRP
jgi:hypothetical protein